MQRQEDDNECSLSSIRTDSAVKIAMEEHKVVPDVLNVAPDAVLEVQYPDARVNLGNRLTPTQVKDIPRISYPFEEGSYYLLSMVDPDAPSRANPKYREWNHWLVGNIPGDKIEQGETLAEYVGAGPPRESGLHRYVFNVYKQPQGLIKFETRKLSNRSSSYRNGFQIREYAKTLRLGDPIAGNFFQAEYDDYVMTLYAQLAGD